MDPHTDNIDYCTDNIDYCTDCCSSYTDYCTVDFEHFAHVYGKIFFVELLTLDETEILVSSSDSTCSGSYTSS